MLKCIEHSVVTSSLWLKKLLRKRAVYSLCKCCLRHRVYRGTLKLLLLEPDLGVIVDTAMSSRYCPFDCLIIRLSAVWRAYEPSEPKGLVKICWPFSAILQTETSSHLCRKTEMGLVSVVKLRWQCTPESSGSNLVRDEQNHFLRSFHVDAFLAYMPKQARSGSLIRTPSPPPPYPWLTASVAIWLGNYVPRLTITTPRCCPSTPDTTTLQGLPDLETLSPGPAPRNQLLAGSCFTGTHKFCTGPRFMDISHEIHTAILSSSMRALSCKGKQK